MAHAQCMLETEGYKHSEYVIFIAFGWQQWLRERASVAFICTLPVLLI